MQNSNISAKVYKIHQFFQLIIFNLITVSIQLFKEELKTKLISLTVQIFFNLTKSPQFSLRVKVGQPIARRRECFAGLIYIISLWVVDYWESCSFSWFVVCFLTAVGVLRHVTVQHFFLYSFKYIFLGKKRKPPKWHSGYGQFIGQFELWHQTFCSSTALYLLNKQWLYSTSTA